MKARILATSLALLFGGLLVPGNVFAHALLTKSTPAAGSRLSSVPTMIRLWYSEEPTIGMTHVVLTDSSGHVVSVGLVERDESELALHVRIIGQLAAGPYKVTWKTAAADDGHPSNGAFTFVILPSALSAGGAAAGPTTADTMTASSAAAAGALATSGSNQSASAEMPGYVATRTVSFFALLAVIGLAAFRFLVLERSRVDEAEKAALRAQAARAGVAMAVMYCLAAVTRLCLQTAMMSDPTHSATSMLSMELTQTGWGTAWLMQAGAGLLAVLGFAMAIRVRALGWSLAAIAAPILAVSSSLQGHARASAQLPAFAVTIDALHIIGAAGWLGSLLCVVALGLPSVGSPAASRWKNVQALVEAFSPTALACAGLVLLTGITSAWLRLGALAPLWTSTYGQVLLVKIALLIGVASVAFRNWRHVRPALGTEVATQRLARSASIELWIGLLVLVVTAVLVAMPTPLGVGR